MRELEFRGKSCDKWVYGHLLKTEKDEVCCVNCEIKHSNYLIQTDELDQYNEYNQYYITDDDTIGQYTGLEDKNGVKIFEGDILKVHYIGSTENNEVIYDRGAFCVEYSEDYHPLLNEINHCCEVIGNVWDNPELLKESE